MMYRNRKLLDSARNHSCQYCGADDGTIVAAHSNQQRHGKSMGMKASDCFVAFLCFRCHHSLDQGNKLTAVEKEQLWRAAFEKTLPLIWRFFNEDAKALVEADGMGWESILR